MEGRIPARLTASEGRKFAWPVGAAFGVIGGIVWWRGHVTVAAIFAALAALLFVAGLVVPTKLGPVQRAWMGMALVISKITSPIFMGIVYFLVLAPIGIVMRLLGRNPIVHVETNGSFWVDRNAGGEPRRGEMTNQF